MHCCRLLSTCCRCRCSSVFAGTDRSSCCSLLLQQPLLLLLPLLLGLHGGSAATWAGDGPAVRRDARAAVRVLLFPLLLCRKKAEQVTFPWLLMRNGRSTECGSTGYRVPSTPYLGHRDPDLVTRLGWPKYPVLALCSLASYF